ncbi:UPF0711 protein C18orf21 homolog [Tachyglossus aculeatus]|uniref:UPF0711 protein C18orf21 homolog n=1 Tax=Tachyglossus aculeatus TaxID=9261 RepID=UPI0018F37C43|nr:UPF0711 protein C18orf21 homolog [Tachyglossus aculeatus]
MGKQHFLKAAARALRRACPPQARYLMWSYYVSHADKKKSDDLCPRCFQFLTLDICRVRLKPKPKITPQIEKLLKREADGTRRLSFKQRQILSRYKNSPNTLLVTCPSCNKAVSRKGKSRSFPGAPPGSWNTPKTQPARKTPDGKTVKSASKMNSSFGPHQSGSGGSGSPALPFRSSSGQSTPISSSKDPGKRKQHFSQLKMLLKGEETPKKGKGDFRNFLLSL